MKFIHSHFVSIIVFIFLLIFIFAPRVVLAEIATVRDWIGFFPLGAGNEKKDTVPNSNSNKFPDGRSWIYTSSCKQTPDTIPSLSNLEGCPFKLSKLANGEYEFRLYANNEETDDALIARSKIIRVGPTPTPTPPITSKLYNVKGDLDINGNMTVGVTGVIFVSKTFKADGITKNTDGNLNINTNLTNTNADTGLVFVVEGNVNIDPGVTQIDAVIISGGKIYTAGANCGRSSVETTNALTVNGSLISLGTDQIIFCRTFINNTAATEIINQEPKYLVILRDLLSETSQTWSEIP